MAVIRNRGNLQFQAIVRRRGYEPLSKTFNSRKEANDWALTAESAIVRGVCWPNQRIHFMNVLDKFEDWANAKLSAKSVTEFDLGRFPLEAPTCVIFDIFESKTSGRITCRMDGTCDIEVIDSLSEAQKLYVHVSDLRDKDLDIELQQFLDYF